MKLLDKRTTADATKLLIFILVTTIATGLLVVTIGNLTFGETKEYKAVFSDATGVVNGDDIRVAGVKVGNVEDVEIVDRTNAIVTFKVDSDHQLTDSTEATVRYRNLVGQRYIALTQGVGSNAAMQEGETIPLARTAPALDLTVLFNGFKPLFEALSPADVNKLRLRDHHRLPGRGRDAREPAGPHRVGHHDAGRPRPDHRRAHRQPQRGDGDPRQPRRRALRPAGQAAAVRRRAVPGPRGDPRLARLGLGAGRRDLRPGDRHPPGAHRGRQAAPQGRGQPRRAARPRSTGPCRCCRSSWRRSAGRRSTAPGSTSTCATSRAR